MWSWPLQRSGMLELYLCSLSSLRGAHLIDNRQLYLYLYTMGDDLVEQSSHSPDLCLQPAFLLWLYFHPEDGGNTFLWNVYWLSTDYRCYRAGTLQSWIWCMLQHWILQRNCCGTIKMPESCTTTLLAFFYISTNPGIGPKLVWQWNNNPFGGELPIETQITISCHKNVKVYFVICAISCSLVFNDVRLTCLIWDVLWH
jgi:hypothetical protein